MKNWFKIILVCLTICCFFPIQNVIAQSIPVQPGWNLLSLPVGIPNATKQSLFPTAVSNAYIYQNEYLANDSLENGIGFWLKYDSSQTIQLSGDTIYQATIPVRAGWNIIGSLTMPVAVNTIWSDSAGIMVSQIFLYVPGVGYQQTDTILPGKGYWVKVSQDGKIFMTVANIPCPGNPSVIYSGRTYNTVQIGYQCWLKENLNIGTRIDGSDNQTNNSLLEKYCYNNDTTYCITYGGLYQWGEAMQYSTTERAQGVCPSGWHIPSYAELDQLRTSVGSNGNALIAIGLGSGEIAGTNWSGFSALLAGCRQYSGGFFNPGYYTWFWSSRELEFDAMFAITMTLLGGHNIIPIDTGNKVGGFSVRCIKDN